MFLSDSEIFLAFILLLQSEKKKVNQRFHDLLLNGVPYMPSRKIGKVSCGYRVTEKAKLEKNQKR